MWSPGDAVDALRQPRAAFGATRHRPWPLPQRPWVMGQTWQDLLFAHWPVGERLLRRHVPEEIPLDTYDGTAWVGVTPFVVTGARPRLMLPVPGLSRFPEINARTYTTIGGKPGIWFFSLDTPNRFAVAAARRVYRLPYFPSRIGVSRDGDRIRYASRRTQEDAPAAEFAASYGPTGPAAAPEPASFAHWATERYCLYTLDDAGRVLRGEIHHPPWPLRPAHAEISYNRMGAQIGADLSGDPVVHFADRQDVVFWLLQRV